MLSVFIFILILSFLVIIHELGHFLIARKHGVKVNEFGLGYPPKALTLFTAFGTPFTLNWIPFGGFVRLEGEDGPELGTEQKETHKSEREFFRVAVWQKLSIVLAGPIVNFIFGIIAFSIVFSVTGIPQQLVGQARIEQIMPGSPAQLAGLEKGSNIIGFITADSVRTQTPGIKDVQAFVAAHKGETVTVITSPVCVGVACAEAELTRELYLRKDSEIPEGQGSIGVIFSDYYLQRYPWYLMPLYGSWYGLKQAVQLGFMMVQALGMVVSNLFTGGGVSADVAGPIGIVHQAQKSNILSSGWMMALSFAGMLSINLAIMNILPIPALDGGRAFFIVLGGLIGQKRIEKIENYANYGGFIALIGLIVLISLRDIHRIIQGG